VSIPEISEAFGAPEYIRWPDIRGHVVPAGAAGVAQDGDRHVRTVGACGDPRPAI
jgi:hypothetical protein